MTETNTLEKVHTVLFDMLKAIAKLCEENDIEYFLDSGTLLGAVRHKDFIPWDDDADITMKRDEYEKFVKVASRLPEPYRLVRPDEYGGYFFDFVPRVVNTEAPLHPDTPADLAQNCFQNRMAVDIFLIEDAPADERAFKKTVFRQKLVYGYAMGHRFKSVKRPHTFVEKLKIGILSFLGKFRSFKSILRQQDEISLSFHHKDTPYYSISNTLVNDLDKRYPKEAFSSSVKLPLRGTLFSCPVGYDTVLTTMYGDYMTPPPPEERRPIHVE